MGEWRELIFTDFLGDEVEVDKMGGVCSTNGKKSIHNFDEET
jgi:hypothetical protein